MNWALELLSENGKISMVRFILLLCAANALGLAWYGAVYGKDQSMLVFGILGIVTTGKVAQKFAEKKDDPKTS